MQYQELANFIRAKRETLGVSLSNFCFKNNVEPATLSRVENGIQEPRISTLKKIAAGFGQTPAEFLTEFEKKL